MKNNRTKKVVADCLRKNRIALLLFPASVLLNIVIFVLYDLTTEPIVYAAILLFAVLFVFLLTDFLAELKNAKERELGIRNILVNGGENLNCSSLKDSDYIEMLGILSDEIQKLQTDYSAKQNEDKDYYTAWVHQIKTPISVMKLQLENEKTDNYALSFELFRIEQYVEMVLDYIRLDGTSNDLVLKEYVIDPIIRDIIHKYASQFILKKIKLNYDSVDTVAVTDLKWFSFIIEQLLSNALKYTPNGSITISGTPNSITVSDTGIGIAAEDLPRIFEKGYTGLNGRIGQKSSGLGLFLCRKAASLINVDITVQSTVGRGSSFCITFPENKQFLP